jgi:hypothetical protein
VFLHSELDVSFEPFSPYMFAAQSGVGRVRFPEYAPCHADSDEGGHQFQFDRGHHSNLMAAKLASFRRPVLLMS